MEQSSVNCCLALSQLICGSSSCSTIALQVSYLSRYQAVDTNEEGVFKGVSDRFNGITIDSTSEACDDAQFDGILSSM